MENNQDDILVFEFKKDLYSCKIYSQPNKNIEKDTKIHSIILDVYNETFKNNPINKDLNLVVIIKKFKINLYIEFNNPRTSIKRIVSKTEFKYSRLEPKLIISNILKSLFVEMYNYRKGVTR